MTVLPDKTLNELLHELLFKTYSKLFKIKMTSLNYLVNHAKHL